MVDGERSAMRSLAVISAVIVGIVGAVQTVFSSPWDDREYRNAEGWRVCAGYLDKTTAERERLPKWCEDWATGDV